MSTPLPHDWLGLTLIVFALGLKHGIDPDHLATIDGLTRFNAELRPRLARWCGCLFSLGHGVVVTLVAGLVGALATEWSPPEWLEPLGAWISIAFLLALGIANLAAVWRTPAGEMVQPGGIKSRWLGRYVQSGEPLMIASIGALFALSFDTWSLAALFALTAANVAGAGLALGFVFTAGMMVADGVNGLCVARLLRTADARARVASRVMGIAIAVLSFAVAALGLARMFAPQFAGDVDASLLGAGVIATLLASFAIALWLSRTASRPAP